MVFNKYKCILLNWCYKNLINQIKSIWILIFIEYNMDWYELKPSVFIVNVLLQIATHFALNLIEIKSKNTHFPKRCQVQL